ncbi:hypothetical protein EJB05_00544, partial [Eragrostis curvula]
MGPICDMDRIPSSNKPNTRSSTGELQVISVWVPGGDLGAASIIRKAYDNQESWRKISRRAWVKLAHPFISQEFVESKEEPEVTLGTGVLDREQSLVETRNTLDKEDYLVVLEDVSSNEVWDTIRNYFPEKGNRNRIVVVITQQFQVASVCTGSPYIMRFWADFSLYVFSKQDTLIGRLSKTEELFSYQSKAHDADLRVVSVWGMAGAGKSALVRAYCAEMYMFLGKCVWVDVTHPFELRAFCQSLNLQLNSHSLQNDGDPVKECQKILKDHRSQLLVIDNLQFKEDWDAIEDTLAFRPSGTHIIVITNDESIALHCAGREEFMLNVKALEAEAAFDLFRREVCRDKNWTEDEVAKEKWFAPLFSMCGGLPKVIVTVADYVRGIRPSDLERIDIPLIGNFMLNLETMPAFACLHDVLRWMHDHISSLPEIIKQHVAYLLIFPRHCSIRRRRLLMRWVAEGYSKDSEHNTSDEDAEQIFLKLMQLTMIQPSQNSAIGDMRINWYSASPFIYEYMISRPREENIATAIELFKLSGACRRTSQRRGRHLVIEESWLRDRIVFENIDFLKLRSLTVFGYWRPFFISESMKVLRVLDLEDASGVTNKDLQNILERLTRLKYLSLRGCREISYLPSPVGELRQLQTLDIRHTSVATLPASIAKLRKIQYLRAGTNTTPEDPSAASTVAFSSPNFRRCGQLAGAKVQSGVGELTALHTLGDINLGAAGGEYFLKELMDLTQLRKLGVSGLCKKNIKDFCSAISGLYLLQSLSVWLEKSNQDWLYDRSHSLQVPGLQSLKLYGLTGKLPEWIKLDNLRKLNLEIDMLSEDDVTVLGKLPELRILRLRVNPPRHSTLHFGFDFNGNMEWRYVKLKVLEVASRSDLLLEFTSNAIFSLEVLKAGCCSARSKLQFDGLRHIHGLKEVWIIGSHDNTLGPDNKTIEQYLEEAFTERRRTKPVLKREEINPSAQTSTEGNSQTQASAGGNRQYCSFPFLPRTPSSSQ